jgi:hypothetical protein
VDCAPVPTISARPQLAMSREVRGLNGRESPSLQQYCMDSEVFMHSWMDITCPSVGFHAGGIYTAFSLGESS